MLLPRPLLPPLLRKPSPYGRHVSCDSFTSQWQDKIYRAHKVDQFVMMSGAIESRLCYAMRCDAMRCDAMRCDAMRCDAMRCDAMLSSLGRFGVNFFSLTFTTVSLLSTGDMWVRAERSVA